MRQGIIEGNKLAVRQDTEDHLAELEFMSEIQIADRIQAQKQQRSADTTGDLTAIGVQGAQLIDRLSNPSPFDSAGIRKLRDYLNLENIDPIDLESLFSDNIDLGGGFSVKKDSPLGSIFSTSSDFVKELSEGYAGGLKGLIDILGR